MLFLIDCNGSIRIEAQKQLFGNVYQNTVKKIKSDLSNLCILIVFNKTGLQQGGTLLI
jgi:hypothetical protein